jgi:hypothetical protein
MNPFHSIDIARLGAVTGVRYSRRRFYFIDQPFMVALRLAAGLGLLAMTQIFASVNAQTTDDDSLKIYAVNVAKTPPFKKQYTGYGIYLGQGTVITAAHVVGHWPFFTHPRVLVAGLDLPAQVLKLGSAEQVDLALLAVDQTQLPVSLRLRRNPLCHMPLVVGMEVIDVVPERTSRARIISTLSIAPILRDRFDTLIDHVEGSGSGIFDARRKCLLGIASAEVLRYNSQMRNGQVRYRPADFAGYFVSAAKIAKFLPEDLHP